MATRGGGMSGEPLPWLEPVEDEDEPPALSARKMGAAILIVLVVRPQGFLVHRSTYERV